MLKSSAQAIGRLFPTLEKRQIYSILPWTVLLLIAAGNAVTLGKFFAGVTALVVCVGIAGIAYWSLDGDLVPRKVKTLALAIVLIFCSTQLLFTIFRYAPKPTNHAWDFSAYYIASQVERESPATGFYSLPMHPDGRVDLMADAPSGSAWKMTADRFHTPSATPFIYPPFFLLVVKPLAYIPLPFDALYRVWNALMTLLMVGSVILILKAARVPLTLHLLLIVGVGVFSYYPFIEGLILGQANCLILFLLSAGILAASRQRWFASGLAFAIATFLKLTPGIVLPVFAVHRKWKWLAAYTVWMTVLLAISLWQFGLPMHAAFWHHVLPGIGLGAPLGVNASIVALVQELFVGRVSTLHNQPNVITPLAGLVSRSVAFLLLGIFLSRLAMRHKQNSETHDIAATILLGLAISPISWWHHYTLAILPILFLWGVGPTRMNRPLFVFFILSGSNVLGFILVLISSPAPQFLLSAVQPILAITVALSCVNSPREQMDPRDTESSVPTPLVVEA